ECQQLCHPDYDDCEERSSAVRGSFPIRSVIDSTRPWISTLSHRITSMKFISRALAGVRTVLVVEKWIFMLYHRDAESGSGDLPRQIRTVARHNSDQIVKIRPSIGKM